MNAKRLLATLMIVLMLAGIGYAQATTGSTQTDTSQTDTSTKSKKSKKSKASADTPASTETTTTTETKQSASTSTTKAASSKPASGSDKVWVNKDSKIYHEQGDRWYGKTKNGEYMTRSEAESQGYRAAKKGGSSRTASNSDKQQ